MILPVYDILFSSQIAVHLQIAIDYYDELSSGLGEKFLSEFETQIVGISQNPHSRAIRYDDVRFALMDGFHYDVHYYQKNHEKRWLRSHFILLMLIQKLIGKSPNNVICFSL